MFFLHYEVGPCPKCGSLRTGLIRSYIRGSGDVARMTASKLAEGEFVRYVYDRKGMTTFCYDCDLEWAGTYKLQFISPATRQKIIERSQISQTEIEAVEMEKMEDVFQDDFGIYSKPKKKKNYRLLKMISPVKPIKETVNSLGSDIFPQRMTQEQKEMFDELESDNVWEDTDTE